MTPVFKKGSKHVPSNYRPISLTCLVVKVMERCVHKNITAFLNDHDKLKTTQHGFRLNHSCQTQLLETLYQWAGSVDNRKSTDAIFLDFSKAFDSVPHQRLLMKLNHIGIRGPLLQWIESFLSGREQRVVIEGHSSKWSHVTSGVPQGSILGPLLFLIYINDIGENLTSPTRLFADDCVLYREITNPSDRITLQQDLDLILRWSQLWQLPLNLSKCNALCITTKRNYPPSHHYTLNNTKLIWANTFTYLGIKIQHNLK